jgi:hypothetical protein
MSKSAEIAREVEDDDFGWGASAPAVSEAFVDDDLDLDGGPVIPASFSNSPAPSASALNSFDCTV